MCGWLQTLPAKGPHHAVRGQTLMAAIKNADMPQASAATAASNAAGKLQTQHLSLAVCTLLHENAHVNHVVLGSCCQYAFTLNCLYVKQQWSTQIYIHTCNVAVLLSIQFPLIELHD